MCVCSLNWSKVIYLLIRALCHALGSTCLCSCHSVTVFYTNTFEGEVPPANPSFCAGPPGKNLSAFSQLTQQRSTTSKFNSVPSELLGRPWWTQAACMYFRHTQRKTAAAQLLFFPRPHCDWRTRLTREMLIQKVFPNASFIFQYWDTAAASYINKVYLETLLKLNCKHIWMFYGSSYEM